MTMVDEQNISINMGEAVNLEVNLPEKTKAINMDVFFQDEVTLDVDLSLMYIKSGQKEIEDYVNNVSKPEIDRYVEQEAEPKALEIVERITEPFVTNYLETDTKPKIDDYTDEKLDAFNLNAQDKTQIVNDKAQTAIDKAKEASDSASNALTSEENALTSENNAKTSEINAKNSEIKAEEYASKVVNVYKYKGSVATFDNLPSSAEIGDVYNVEDTGANYAWTGSVWDNLGGIASLDWGTIKGDISNQTDLNTRLSTIDQDIIDLNTDVANNLSEINDLQLGKANDSDVVHKSGDETITGVKIFNSGCAQFKDPLVLRQGGNEGGQLNLQKSEANCVLKSDPYIDAFMNNMRFIALNSLGTIVIPFQIDFQSNAAYASNPAVGDNSTQVATTQWFNQKMQVVSSLPANPDPNVFYFIKE